MSRGVIHNKKEIALIRVWSNANKGYLSAV